MKRKAWNWMCMVGIGSGLGAGVEAGADSSVEQPLEASDVTDERIGDRVESSLGKLVEAFNTDEKALADAILDIAGPSDQALMQAYLGASQRELGSLDIHDITFYDGLVVMRARSADGQWRQISCGVTADGTFAFVRFDTMRY